jgi:hypothetical protein
LAHRLHRVTSNGTRIRWEAIKAQFGQEYASLKPFRQEFRETLRQVVQVYPAARITAEREGVTLFKSPPPIPTRVAITAPELAR